MAKRERDFGPEGVDYGTSSDYERGLVKMSSPRPQLSKKLASVLIYGIIITFLALNTLNFFIANNNRSNSDELSAMMGTAYNPSFKVRYDILGAEIIRAWYSPTILSSPVPLGAGVSWPSSNQGTSTEESPVEEPVVTDETNGSTGADETDQEPVVSTPAPTPAPTQSVSTSGMTVTGIAFLNGQQVIVPGTSSYQEQLLYSVLVNGQYFGVSITLAINDLDDFTTKPMLISPPTLVTSIQDPVTNPNPGIPSDWKRWEASDSLKTQINAWAQSWTTNNTVALKQVTGDSSSDSYYTGLTPGDWRYSQSTLQILWAFQRANVPSQVVMQIEWVIQAPDVVTKRPSDGSDVITPGPRQIQRMDLLVSEADSGLPKIIAWGPSGTYSILEAKMNALTQAEFDILTRRTGASN